MMALVMGLLYAIMASLEVYAMIMPNTELKSSKYATITTADNKVHDLTWVLFAFTSAAFLILSK